MGQSQMLRKFTHGIVLCLLPVVAMSEGAAQQIEQLLAQGKNTQALQVVQTALRQQPANQELQFYHALALEKSGDLTGAVVAYEKLLNANPNLPEAHNNLAGIYVQQGELGKAKSLLETGLRTHTTYATLFENLSAINVTMARDSYSKALQLNLKPVQLHLKPLASLAGQDVATPQLAVASPAPQAPSAVKTEIRQPVAVKTIPAKMAPQVKPAVTSVVPDKVTTTLQAWAAAWSAQAVDMYLSFYHQDFIEPGMSRQQWENLRRQRLKAPRWIKVSLSNIKVLEQTDDQTVVSFQQHYQSNSYRDNGFKKVTLKNVPDGVQIIREESL